VQKALLADGEASSSHVEELRAMGVKRVIGQQEIEIEDGGLRMED
jgi:hypothetical protein